MALVPPWPSHWKIKRLERLNVCATETETFLKRNFGASTQWIQWLRIVKGEKINMKFEKNEPKVQCITELDNFKYFLQFGRRELCECLKNLLNLNQVRIQACELNKLKKWLNVDDVEDVMDIPQTDDEICIVSQIKVDNELIAYFPYVLKGKNVKIYLTVKSLISKLAEAISDQITICYLQDFRGGDWIFGENLAKIIVSNCISTRKYDGIKFAHLIEKMEQMASSTFEGEFFPTGVIVCSDLTKYKDNYFEFRTPRDIDTLDKREWFLANGRETFFLLDSNTNSKGIYRKSISSLSDYVGRFFDDYYLTSDLKTPDFIVRAIGPNEISVSDSDGKEFVKIENIWRYRHHKNITQFMVEQLGIEYKVSYAILLYILKCSRNHISSILWMPKDCSEEAIGKLTMNNRVKIWNSELNIMNESHQVLIEKILASDGAVVIDGNGKIIFESVFANMNGDSSSAVKLAGSGETAARLLSQNGVAVKISQDGTIKIFYGNEKLYY